MTKVYRHIGYFNDYKDCKYLFSKSADDAVEYMKLDMGDFHHCDPNEDTDVTDNEPDEKFFKITTDGYFKVRYEKGVDNEDAVDCGWYIDIYQLSEEHTAVSSLADDNIEDYCKHCESYVRLKDILSVQICPNCGKAIVPCSICPKMDGKSYSDAITCNNCPLEVLCKIKNGENYVGIEHSLESFVNVFNYDALNDVLQSQRGYYCTIPKDKKYDYSCDEEIYICYDVNRKGVILMDAVQYGKSFMWRNAQISVVSLMSALQFMYERPIDKLYVRAQ